MLGNNLNLSVVHMKRVFVALAGVGAKAAGDSPQVGAEAAVGAKAAVGALAAADEGAFNMDVDEDASRDNADQFLRTHVVPWLNQLELNAVTNDCSMPESLAAALSEFGMSREKLVQAFKEKVPWVPCVDFQAVPRHSKRPLAHLHVAI